ncbi:MAG: STAS domain-containing protein [Methanospirillaceae archaeon]|nr:STAS domain-containing protein [Methanospirillaceae archaeon]
MEIQSGVKDAILVVSLQGMLDASNADPVEEEIVSIDLLPLKGVIIDLSGLTYMSSSGIRVLIKIRRHLKNANIRFAISSLQPFVHEILDLADLLNSFEIYPDIADARAAFTT